MAVSWCRMAAIMSSTAAAAKTQLGSEACVDRNDW